MRSGDRWKLRGARRKAQETAQEAARRAGMSVGEWLDSVISAERNEPESRHAAQDYSEHETVTERDEEHRRRNNSRVHPRGPRRASLPAEDSSKMDHSVRQLNARLDELDRQLTRVAQLSEA